MDKNELFATMPVPQALRRMIVPAAVSQIIVLGAVPTVLSNVMSSLVRSIGHSREAGFGIGRVAMVLAILRWAVFNIPMLVLLNALVGMYGILWTPAIGDGITVLLSLAAYLRWRPRAKAETPQ